MNLQPESRRQSFHHMSRDPAGSAGADPCAAFANRLCRRNSNRLGHGADHVSAAVVPRDLKIVAGIGQLLPDRIDGFGERLVRRRVEDSDEDTSMRVDPALDADRLEQSRHRRAFCRDDRCRKSELATE